jgi:hypothetical protein
MIEIRPGDRVLARSATNEWLKRRAVTGIVHGHDFPVVWVCVEQEWQDASNDERRPDGVPWPAEEVQVDTQLELGATERATPSPPWSKLDFSGGERFVGHL